MGLNWTGDEVESDVQRAAMLAIDATMSAAIIHAKKDHGAGAHALDRFETQSSEAERSIRIVQRARPIRGGAAGRWGSIGVVYFRRLELGFQGKDRLGRVVDAQPYPSLRPAARDEYPNLAKRIRAALAKRIRAARRL